MDRYEVSLDGEELVVDTAKLIRGPDRDVQAFLTPPRGPSCLEES